MHKEEKYVMSIPPDQLKCVVSLAGDTITQAVSKLIKYGAIVSSSFFLYKPYVFNGAS